MVLLGFVVVLAVIFTSLCFSSTCGKYPSFVFIWVIWYAIQNTTQTKIIPTVNLYYQGQPINPDQSITVPPYAQLLLQVVYKNKDEADLMGPGKITVDEKEFSRPYTQNNNIYSFTYL